MAGCDVSEWRRDDGHLISTDPTRLDLPMIVDFLAQSYWAQGTPETLLRKSIDQALSFGLYASDDQQIGYARIVSDFSRFAWLSDVFVLDSHRGLGLGVWLVDTITKYPPVECDRSICPGDAGCPRRLPEVWLRTARPARDVDAAARRLIEVSRQRQEKRHSTVKIRPGRPAGRVQCFENRALLATKPPYSRLLHILHNIYYAHTWT